MPPFTTYLHSYMSSQFDVINARVISFNSTLANHTASLRRLKQGRSSRRVDSSHPVVSLTRSLGHLDAYA
ncbi:hypothetical protein Scep_004749 [Stephania cephalantha]|uniref:Uncharacterized protein n=1 Tax=Stephania cephalantha TaxID=152367 RepID=A0AAP0KVI3_9MAGN